MKLTEQEIIEGNNIIAEFYGDISGITSYPDEPLEFHSSWNWLMPVVEKISGLDSKGNEEFEMHQFYTTKANLDCGIYHAYGQVIDFIKWYNENKETTI